MSSSVKGLIAGIAALVLLGGGIAVMKFTEPKETADEETSSAVEEALDHSIYSGNGNDVTSVEVKNNAGGYTVKRITKAASDEEQSTYAVEGLEKIPKDESLVSSFASNAASLDYIVKVDDNPEDLSKFGLSSPETQVTVAYDGTDAKKVTLLVGNNTPAGDIYVKLSDSPAVYTASASFVKAYTFEKEYFVSRTILEEPTGDDYPIVKTIKVERPDLEKPIIIEYSGENESGGTSATHVMTSPVKAYLDVSSSVNYTHGLFGLYASNVLSLSPSKEELEFSGINNPSCTVTMTLDDGKEYVLKTGIPYTASSDGTPGYTGYFEGTDVIWHFSESSVPWVTMKPEDAMSSLVFGSYIYDLKSLEVTAGSKTEKFDFEGSDADSYKVKLNGKEFDTERYKSFYQALIKAPAEEICTSDEGTGALIASFSLKYNNGHADEKIEFYEGPDRKVIIKKDGETCFRCRSSFTEKSLLPNISNINGESDFVVNW